MAESKLQIFLLSSLGGLLFNTFCGDTLPFSVFDKTIKIDRFLGRCPGKERLPSYIKDVHIMQDRRIYYISAKLVMKQDMNNQLKVQLKLQRCRSKESLDTCEPYPDVLIKNICEMLNLGFQPWTPFMQSLRPHISCPIKKGVYTSTNGTFDGTALSAFAVEGWYWKVQANILEPTDNNPNKVVMCVYVEGQVVII